MTEQKTVIEGRVAYDVENDEWVMYIEDRFVYMGDLYDAVNRRLEVAGERKLIAGDELEVRLRKA